jgi:hypothetical protein
LITLNSANEIKGNPRIFLAKIWLDFAGRGPDLAGFGFSLDFTWQIRTSLGGLEFPSSRRGGLPPVLAHPNEGFGAATRIQ